MHLLLTRKWGKEVWNLNLPTVRQEGRVSRNRSAYYPVPSIVYYIEKNKQSTIWALSNKILIYNFIQNASSSFKGQNACTSQEVIVKVEPQIMEQNIICKLNKILQIIRNCSSCQISSHQNNCSSVSGNKSVISNIPTNWDLAIPFFFQSLASSILWRLLNGKF